MEDKKKQERKVVHLQIGDKHLYYGSISRLFDDFTEDELGVSYYKTKNNLAKLGVIVTDKCTIRQGFLITKQKKKQMINERATVICVCFEASTNRKLLA